MSDFQALLYPQEARPSLPHLPCNYLDLFGFQVMGIGDKAISTSALLFKRATKKFV
jgi:hypothetical protein